MIVFTDGIGRVISPSLEPGKEADEWLVNYMANRKKKSVSVLNSLIAFIKRIVK